MSRTILFSFLLLCLFSQKGVQAAAANIVLNQFEGKVLVGNGELIEAATEGQALEAGAPLLVGPESSASVYYKAQNCTLQIPAATIVSISEIAPCLPGEKVASVSSLLIEPTADVPQADPYLPPAGPFAGAAPALLVGGAIAVGVGALILLTGDDEGSGSRPISEFN